MNKSPDAFRTISEVAEWLDVPTHVLRFWESRFSQIKPVKRAGGRRYYRPSDMRLIGGVKALLHDQGMTIRAVQKLLREEGIKHVAEHSQALDAEDADDVFETAAVETPAAAVAPAPAARGTRDATPAPVDDETPDSEPADDAPEFDLTAGTEDAPVMFRRTPRADSEPAAKEAAPTSDADSPSAPASPIPAPADVPDRDPDDTDPAFARDASVAARLVAMSSSRLKANADALLPLRDQLADIRDRFG